MIDQEDRTPYEALCIKNGIGMCIYAALQCYSSVGRPCTVRFFFQ